MRLAEMRDLHKLLQEAREVRAALHVREQALTLSSVRQQARSYTRPEEDSHE